MKRLLPALLVLAFAHAAVRAEEHRVEPLAEAPPEELAAEITATLGESGVRVLRGESRTVCDIWLCKEWKLASGEPGSGLIYPFAPGQLIGAIRYSRRGADFRDQDINSGVYTLRYSQQPVDGAHVGTSITRDFLLLLPAEADTSPAALEYKPLVEHSKEAAQSSHPALLSMQKAEGEAAAPSMRANVEKEWEIVRLGGTAVVGEKKEPLVFDLVVVGVAEE